jgi:hypothetical protein
VERPRPRQPGRRLSWRLKCIDAPSPPGHFEGSFGEAGDGWQDAAQGADQSHDAQVAGAQGGSVALFLVGLVDALIERRADGRVLAGTLDHEQALIDAAGFLDRLGKVVEVTCDAEVGGVVDRGLDSERAAALEVLLDARALVAEVGSPKARPSERSRAASSATSREIYHVLTDPADGGPAEEKTLARTTKTTSKRLDRHESAPGQRGVQLHLRRLSRAEIICFVTASAALRLCSAPRRA